jgi:hypothetical protein
MKYPHCKFLNLDIMISLKPLIILWEVKMKYVSINLTWIYIR